MFYKMLRYLNTDFECSGTLVECLYQKLRSAPTTVSPALNAEDMKRMLNRHGKRTEPLLPVSN